MNTLENLMDYEFGEIYLNSIDKDGTGFGYDLSVMNKLKSITENSNNYFWGSKE